MRKGLQIAIVVGMVVTTFMNGNVLGAAKYPEKAITIVCHTAPGAGADIFAREGGKALQNILGNPVVIENRPGGSGAIAMQFAAGARPDGYTLLMATNTLLLTPIRQATPKKMDDFTPVARIVLDPMVLYVRADSKYDEISFLQEVKSGAGNLKIGCPQAGSPETIAIEALVKQYGGKIHMVPYPDGAKSMTAVLSGDVDASMGELAEIAPQLLGKTIKIMLSLTSQRVPQYPDVKTFAEKGYPNVVVDKFRGFVAPKGVSSEIIKILEGACKKALDDPGYKKTYTNNLQTPAYQNAQDFGKFMKEQENRYRAYFASQKK